MKAVVLVGVERAAFRAVLFFALPGAYWLARTTFLYGAYRQWWPINLGG